MLIYSSVRMPFVVYNLNFWSCIPHVFEAVLVFMNIDADAAVAVFINLPVQLQLKVFVFLISDNITSRLGSAIFSSVQIQSTIGYFPSCANCFGAVGMPSVG